MKENMKKIVIIVLVVLLVAVGVALFFVLNRDKSENYTLFSDKQEKAVKVSMPQDKGFTTKDEGRTSTIEFNNETGGYRIDISLRDNLKTLYDTNLERHRDSDGFNEVEINKFKGYEYNITSFAKEIYLNLGEGKNGLYDIVNIYITRTADHDKGVNDLVELKEVKDLFKSIKVVNYIAPEEVAQEDEVNNEVNDEVNDEVNNEVKEQVPVNAE